MTSWDITFDIWALGSNGEQIAAMLQGISGVMYTSSGTFDLTVFMRNFAGLSILIGFITVILSGAFRTGNILGILKWFGSIIVITIFFFSMPVKCKVHDSLIESTGVTAPAWYTPVENVPVGLAMPLSMVTTIEKTLTDLIDDNLTDVLIPWTSMVGGQFLTMSRGGLGAAASALVALNDVAAGDPRNVINATVFVKDCIAPAISMDVLPANVLASSQNLVQTIEDNALLLNFFSSYTNADNTMTVYNCASYWPRLIADLNAVQGQRRDQYATSGFMTVNDSSAADVLLEGVAKNTINYTLGTDQLRTNAEFYKFTDQGIGEAMGYDPGAMQVLSEKTREFKANQRSYGMMSFLWLPKIKTVLLTIWCGLFVMLIPFVLMNNFGVLKGWLGGFIWLSLWGPMLAIINAIYMSQMLQVFATMSTSGLTYGNRFTVWQEATDVLTGIGIACSWVLPLSGMIAGWLGIKAPQTTAVERGLQGAIAGTGAATATYAGLRRLAESGDQAQVHNDYDRAHAGKPSSADRSAFMGSMANSMGAATSWNRYGHDPAQTSAMRAGQGAAGFRGEYNQANKWLAMGGSEQSITNAGAMGALKSNINDLKVGVNEGVGVVAQKADSTAVTKSEQATEQMSATTQAAKNHGYHVADDASVRNNIAAGLSTTDATDMAKRVQATEALSRHLQDNFKLTESQANKVANTVAKEGSASIGMDGRLGLALPGNIASASITTALQETSSNRDAQSDEKTKQVAADITKSLSASGGIDVSKQLGQMHSESVGLKADATTGRGVSTKDAYASTLGAAMSLVTGVSTAKALQEQSSQLSSMSRNLKSGVGVDQTTRALGYFASGQFDGIKRDISSEAGMTSAINQFRETLDNKDDRAQFMEKFLQASNPGLEAAMSGNFVSGLQHHEVVAGTSGRFSPEAMEEAKSRIMGSHSGDQIIGAFQGIRDIYANAAGMSNNQLNSIQAGLKDGSITQGNIEAKLKDMNPGSNQNTIDRQKDLMTELAQSEKSLMTKPTNESLLPVGGKALGAMVNWDKTTWEKSDRYLDEAPMSTGVAGDLKKHGGHATGYDSLKTQSNFDQINNQLASLEARGLASQAETAAIYKDLQDGVSGMSAAGRDAALAAAPSMVMDQGHGWQSFVRENSIQVASSDSTMGLAFGSSKIDVVDPILEGGGGGNNGSNQTPGFVPTGNHITSKDSGSKGSTPGGKGSGKSGARPPQG